MFAKVLSKSFYAGLSTMVAAMAFIAGLFLNTAGLAPTAEAFNFSKK